ncbi:MAG: O-antigen ligase family protein [Peptococcaceae bacterium]|nr:O-antigen ligase family protein [Peptococcaceae bacterium]
MAKVKKVIKNNIKFQNVDNAAKEEKIEEKKYDGSDRLIWNLLIVLISVTPLLFHIYLNRLISPKIAVPVYYYTNFTTDSFSSYKFIFILVMTGLIFILFLYDLLFNRKNIKINVQNISLYCLMCFSLLSVLLSKYKYFSIFGLPERREGLLTFFACLLITFITANIKIKGNKFYYLIYALIPITVVNLVFGILYISGVKVLNDPAFVRFLIGSGQYAGGQMQIASTSYFVGTLSHGNYISGMASILYTVFLVYSLWGKNKFAKAISFIMSIFAAMMVFTSLSMSGMVTIIFSLILIAGVILYGKQRLKNIEILSLNLLTLIISFILLNKINPDVSKQLIDEPIAYLLVVGLAIVAIAVFAAIKYPDVIFKKYKIYTVLVVVLFIVSTGLLSGRIEQRFTYEVDRINTAKIISQLQEDELNLPQPGISMGTGRFYIWKQTIQLILQKPIIGYGFDTLAFEYPQYDPAKIPALIDGKTIVDKPHNMFLEIAYSMGIPALLILIVVIVSYIVKFFKRFSADFSDENVMDLSIFLGFMAFLLQAMFNDANIGYQLFFWIFLGIGLSRLSETKIFTLKNNQSELKMIE